MQPLDGSPIMPSTDSQTWHDALVRADIPAAPLHAARHTTASLLLRAKIPEPIIIKILGHNNYVTSVGYMDIDEAQTREAMTAIAAFMPYTGNA
jgi:integrase